MMHNPPHPGRIIKKACIDRAEIKISEVAAKLQLSQEFLIKLINNDASARITPELANKLSSYLNTSSKMWLNMQSAYDLWCLEKNSLN